MKHFNGRVIDMESILEELIDVFEKQSRLQSALLDTLGHEKQAIIGSELSALQEATVEKENLVREIKKLEKKRVRALAALEVASGKKCSELTMETLAEHLKEPYASRLTKCRNDMVSQIENVKKLNEGNKNLLTHSIDLVSGSLRLLNNLMNSNAVYYRTGKIQNKDHSGRVLSGDV